jgi:hypothetical protein
MCSVAGLVLASCATMTTAKPHVTGLPAISISVPLSTVACTTNNSCVAIGTSPFDVSPTSVGEYRTSQGRWSALTVPSADSSTFVVGASCWSNGCLFVGSQSNGDLVWLYDASAHTLVAETPPAGGSGIDAVSCYTSMTCAIFDSSQHGSRFLTTENGGSTWSSPVTVGAQTLDTVTGLSCDADLACIASIVDSSNGVAAYVSSDGGATWTPRTGFSTVTWTALESLNCNGKHCLGVANTSSGWRLVRTDNFGRSWKKVASLPSSDVTLACTRLERCVVGGTKNLPSNAPWIATVVSDSVVVVKLKYVPSPISDVACGSKICVAIGVTTVVSLRP